MTTQKSTFSYDAVDKRIADIPPSKMTASDTLIYARMYNGYSYLKAIGSARGYSPVTEQLMSAGRYTTSEQVAESIERLTSLSLVKLIPATPHKKHHYIVYNINEALELNPLLFSEDAPDSDTESQSVNCDHYSQYIYVLSDKKYQKFKFGMTNNFERRITELRETTPFEIDTLAVFKFNSRVTVARYERDAHKHLSEFQTVKKWRKEGIEQFPGWSEWYFNNNQTSNYLKNLIADLYSSGHLDYVNDNVMNYMGTKWKKDYLRYTNFFPDEPLIHDTDEVKQLSEDSYNDTPFADGVYL